MFIDNFGIWVVFERGNSKPEPSNNQLVLTVLNPRTKYKGRERIMILAELIVCWMALVLSFLAQIPPIFRENLQTEYCAY